MSEKPGQDLPRTFGSYSLLKLLARGGMGEIYLARTQGITGFEKYYAVKKLLKRFTHDNDVGGRFVDEAKLGARLQHPNIVQVYDLGRVNEELYMATEFVDGFDLRRVLRFCHEKKKRIPLDIALFIVREVLSGLAYAHRQVDAEGQSINLIHRDISPQNVLVSFEGEVKIIDFGLAKSTQRSQETQANVLLGNFGYMSPEQARGQFLDVRTDIYSCGIVLFELVTGTKRFVEENPLKLLEMVARPTPIMPSDRVPTAPKALDKIYAKATAQDKEERYPTAEAFRDDVATALHRLNPRASRENLAQFLSHLFLGGQAPPSVDNEVLNKSMVLVARDLHAGLDALSATGSAAEDLKNRSLGQGFSEDAPQTASHPLLRSARVGDVLSHEAITGEVPTSAPPLVAEVLPAAHLSALPTPGPAAALPTQGAMGPVSAPVPASPALALSTLAPPAVSTLAPVSPSRLGEVAMEAPVDHSESDLESAFESLGLTAQLPNEVFSHARDVMMVDADSSKPTQVYDSPSWPAEQLSRELEQQLEEQLEQQAADLEVQQQLEAQLAQQVQMQMQMQMQAEEQARLSAQQEEARRRELEGQRQAELAEEARQALAKRPAEKTVLAPPPLVPGLRRPPPLSPPEGLMAVEAPPPLLSRAPTPPPSMRRPPSDIPSIVISQDLEMEITDGVESLEDSLTIDVSEASEEEILVVDELPSQIRPAAKPMGKAPAGAKARRPSGEGNPLTMPPTRRR